MILKTSDLSYRFTADVELRFPDLELNQGDRVLIMGPSGVGKSTFLNLVSGVLPLQAGEIQVLEHRFSALSGRALDKVRANHFGIIFQTFNLIPYLSGFENAALGVQFSRLRASKQSAPMEQEIGRLGASLGLSDTTLSQPAAQLSVGQQQRVAVIRALLGCPELILADEPTSALDPESSERFMSELINSFDASTQSILMVSHNPALAPHFDRVLEFAR